MRREGVPFSPRGSAFAVDPGASGRPESLLAAWVEEHGGRARVVVTNSRDRGRTWSTPVPVPAAAGEQSEPTLAVNRSGVVAVTWLDTRDVRAAGRYNVWTAVSTDGAGTFSPAVRVSTRPTSPTSAGEARGLTLLELRPADHTLWPGGSVASRFPTGGDHFGLAAAPDGSFHAAWIDSRTGSFQVWTARIEVGAAVPVAPATEALPVRGVTLRADRVVRDSTGSATAWVRIQNTSPDTLFGPIRGEWSAGLPNRGGGRSASEPGDVQVIDYGPALGDFTFLPPGGVSAARPWQLGTNERAPVTARVVRCQALRRTGYRGAGSEAGMRCDDEARGVPIDRVPCGVERVRVERGEALIEEQQIRMLEQRARNEDAMPFSL